MNVKFSVQELSLLSSSSSSVCYMRLNMSIEIGDNLGESSEAMKKKKMGFSHLSIHLRNIYQELPTG